MHQLRHYISLALFTTFIFILVGCDKNFEREEEEENPYEPYEAFMLQRIYPNSTFDINAYRNALKSAQQNFTNQKTTSTVSWNLEGSGNIGGRFNCLAIAPSDTNIMYAGSANGGVWKTTDGGLSWSAITDNLPYLAIGAITINPYNENEIWIGPGDLNISGTLYTGNGVYRSTDAGQTWNYVGLPNSHVISNILFGNNSNEIVVSTMGNPFNPDIERCVYKSTNGGITFSKTLFVNDSTGIIEMVQHPSQPNILFASSFTRIRRDQSSIVNSTSVGVYQSNDFGQTWNLVGNGLPNGQVHERLGLAICKSKPNYMYALYSTSDMTNPQMYYSTNGGVSWSPRALNNFNNSAYGTYGWYFGKIYVDPYNEKKLYIPGIYLQTSDNSGINWYINAATNQVHADGHYLSFNSSNSMLYCTDGGIYKSIDNGVIWSDIENIPVNQFYAVTENPFQHGVYAGGVQDNGTMFGNGGNINNFKVLYGGDGFTVDYSKLDSTLIYAESQYGNIVYTNDYTTNSWNTLNTLGQNYNWHTPYFVSKHNDRTIFTAGQQVMRIDDAPYGGAIAISPFLHRSNTPSRVQNISTLSQSDLDSNILYAGTADGLVWSTLDYGVTWNDITPFQGTNYYVTNVSGSPNDKNTVYVTRSGYRSNDNTPLIFKSIDNGLNWQNITGDLPMLAVNDILVAPGDENTLFVANDAGVYYSTNAGVNWNRLGNNLPFVAVLDLSFNYNASKLIAGSFGRGMYTTDVSSILSTSTALASTKNINILFPNPTNNYINIKGDFKMAQVYGTDGRLVKTSTSSCIDISNLPEGLYFIRLDKESRLLKFIKN